MAVGDRQTDLSISETPALLGSCTTISSIYTERSEKSKYPVRGSSLGKNALLIPEVRGEWPHRQMIVDMYTPLILIFIQRSHTI